jgi:hypothetical protein
MTIEIDKIISEMDRLAVRIEDLANRGMGYKNEKAEWDLLWNKYKKLRRQSSKENSK